MVPLIALALCSASSSFAEEVDLVEDLGHPILALSSSDRVRIREKERSFRRKERTQVKEKANEVCHDAGYSNVKTYSILSSKELEVYDYWGELSKTSESLESVSHRPSHFLYKSDWLDLPDGNRHPISNISCTPTIWASHGWLNGYIVSETLTGGSPLAQWICQPLGAGIGYVAGATAIPFKVAGLACEKAADCVQNVYGEVDHLVFDQLICE
jgi:hypothetical protein